MSSLEVIGSPARRQILDALLVGEQDVNSLVALMAISQPAVSKHLRVLREAGLVTSRTDGQRRLYSLQPESLMELDEWLEPYRRYWQTSLDRLAQHLETTRRKK